MSEMPAQHPGDRPSIPFEVEPLGFFHPAHAGDARPGAVQPAGGLPLLEEEPGLWPDLGGTDR